MSGFFFSRQQQKAKNEKLMKDPTYVLSWQVYFRMKKQKLIGNMCVDCTLFEKKKYI